MKKLLTLSSLLLLALIMIPAQEAFAIKVYTGKVTPGERSYDSKQAAYSQSGRRVYRPRWAQTRATNTTTKDTSKNVSSRYQRRSRSYGSRRLTNTQSVRQSSSRPTNYLSRYGLRSYGQNQSNYARIYATAIPQRKPAESVSSTIPVLEVGVKHEKGTRSSLTFQEAFLLDSLEFQMITNNGIAGDPSDFELVIDGQGVPFDEDGSIHVRFNNAARIASGSARSYQVGVRFRDPDLIPSDYGSFMLRLTGARVFKETGSEEAAVRIVGRSMSDVIAYDPTVRVGGTGTGVFTSVPTNSVYSSTLQAGQAATVLSVGLNAQFDDLLVKDITVRNQSNNSLVDDLIERIEAVDGKTGEILGTSRFIGGVAEFDFAPEVYIPRNSRKDIAFVAHLEKNIPEVTGNASFELTLSGSDFNVVSASNGNRLSASSINVSVRNNEYSVVGAAISITTNNQPSDLLVSSGSPSTVFRFQVNNPGAQEISLGRVSLRVNPNGLAYPGGMSVDDFELVRVVNGREIRSTLFTTTSASGQVVVFDAINEEYISPRTTAEYAFKARLENVGGTKGDALAIQVLGDNQYSKSSLAAQRSAGRNFIWSDHSARPHKRGSADWLGGYLLNGLSSNTKVLRR